MRCIYLTDVNVWKDRSQKLSLDTDFQEERQRLLSSVMIEHQRVYEIRRTDPVCRSFSNNRTGCESVKGVVGDSAGSVLPEATLLFYWDFAGSTVGLTSNVGITKDLVIKADLPPGFYDVFVSAIAFTPVCRKIRVVPVLVQELTFHMNADPLVADELGFRVEATAPNR